MRDCGTSITRDGDACRCSSRARDNKRMHNQRQVVVSNLILGYCLIVAHRSHSVSTALCRPSTKDQGTAVIGLGRHSIYLRPVLGKKLVTEQP